MSNFHTDYCLRHCEAESAEMNDWKVAQYCHLFPSLMGCFIDAIRVTLFCQAYSSRSCEVGHDLQTSNQCRLRPRIGIRAAAFCIAVLANSVSRAILD